ncbi:hypothetical protein ES319_D12G260900v1 [Gossypium barbadense]|uniref:Uncharacterized protein n=1 Tax=Gossypium barbadense TaxID=3634 RepID=A0A5J5P2L9_GOSBA|nr:hypothetical protein ES319_D12G260900v1 [Gossypium barbadense]
MFTILSGYIFWQVSHVHMRKKEANFILEAY